MACGGKLFKSDAIKVLKTIEKPFGSINMGRRGLKWSLNGGNHLLWSLQEMHSTNKLNIKTLVVIN